MDKLNLIERLRAVTGFTADEISEADLSVILNTALDEYLWYRPGITLTTAANGITTVADQPNYTIPSDALWVIEVGWNPDTLAGDDVLDDLFLQMAVETFNADHPSELYITYQRFAELRRFFTGHWKILNGEIWLIPCPAQSGNHVAVYYATTKTLAELDNVTDNIFFRLTKGMMKERRGNDLLKGAFRAGTYSVEPRVGEMMLKEAAKELAVARSIAANPYYAERTGPGIGVKSE